MDWIKNFIDLFLHLDKHLSVVIAQYGTWTYAILFLIIFCETGLVVTPFLPGDSLLFAVGAFAAIDSLNLWWLFFLLSIAAILGDTMNYWIGRKFGAKAFARDHSFFFKKEHLERTQKFYERYGGKTIVLARFMPIIRTFAPFVAGIGCMNYTRFFAYNILGGILWVSIFLFGGYFFGNIPFIKNNFFVAILAIVFISLLPGVIEYLRHRRQPKTDSIH